MSFAKKSTEVLFLGLNATWLHVSLPLYYLRNALTGTGYNSSICELTVKTSLPEILDLIYARNPAVLCLSVYIWNSELTLKLLPEVRKILPDSKIVIGGPDPTASPGQYDLPEVDYLVLGSGEAAIRELAENDFCLAERILRREPIPLRDLPFPYLPDDRQQVSDRLLYYEMSRGCPYQCSYCLSHADNGIDRRFDFRGKESEAEWNRFTTEIAALLSFNPRTVKLVDRSFNLDRDFTHRVWKYLINLDCNCCFHFELYPDLLDETDLDLLRTAPPNRIRLEIGIQSIDKMVLEQVGRKSDFLRFAPLLARIIAETSATVHLDLIVGLPEETLSHLLDAINALHALLPAEIQLGFLKVLPSTPMADIAEENSYQWLASPPYTVLSNPWLTYSDISRLQQYAHIIDLYYNTSDFPKTLPALKALMPFTDLLERLTEVHRRQQLTFHSIARETRFTVLRSIFSGFAANVADDLLFLLRQDWQSKSQRERLPGFLR